MSTSTSTVPVDRPLETTQPFTGPLDDLDRLARVAVGTVAVVFTGGQPPALRQPGELLVPRLSPFGRRVVAVPVTVRPVTLAVSVDGLGTADGDVLEHVEVRVSVRFAPDEDHAVVRQLAVDRGPSFGESLMADVLHGVETAVRAAVGLNRSADLRRQSLADLLTDHWMPPRLAENALLVENVTVHELRWPSNPDTDDNEDNDTEDNDTDSEDGDTEDTVEIAEDGPPVTSRSASVLVLSDDARLRRRWEQRTDVDLRAVSTGRTTGARTAIAVVASGSEQDRASLVADELLADDDTLDAMLVVGGATYAEVVTSWFAVLDHDGARLVGVDVSDDFSRLTIDLAPTRRAAAQDAPFDPHDPSVDALRQLLPFDLVAFEGLS